MRTPLPSGSAWPRAHDRWLASSTPAGLYSSAARLVRGGRIALFLDGFDELAPGFRTEMLHALNALPNLRLVMLARGTEHAWLRAVRHRGPDGRAGCCSDSSGYAARRQCAACASYRTRTGLAC